MTTTVYVRCALLLPATAWYDGWQVVTEKCTSEKMLALPSQLQASKLQGTYFAGPIVCHVTVSSSETPCVVQQQVDQNEVKDGEGGQ